MELGTVKTIGVDVSVTGTGICVLADEPFRGAEPVPHTGASSGGWFMALRTGYSLPNSATWPQRHQRIERIARTLINAVEAHQPDAVAIEDVIFASNSRARFEIWSLNYLLRHELWRRDVPVVMVPLDSWRALLGVSWSAIKRQHPEVKQSHQRTAILKAAVCDAIAARHGVNFRAKDEHDMADAFGIAQFIRHRLLYPPAEQETLGFAPGDPRRGKGKGRKSK
jgi:Holliday junction resolvasome RuvABC endonuclease subunit